MKLYVVHGSHPCAAVEKAAELKGIALKKVELPPPAHAFLTRALRFKQRTVPALVTDGGRKVSGSAAIMREFDAQVTEPPMYPSERRAEVEVAERFDDDVLQVHARRIIWTAMKANGKAMPSFLEGSKLPLPGSVVVLNAPVITRIELKLNPGSIGAQEELAQLPATLDKLDDWCNDGLLHADHPNAAALKLGASIRLLSNIADLSEQLEGRPILELARKLYPVYPGAIPVGALQGVPHRAPVSAV